MPENWLEYDTDFEENLALDLMPALYDKDHLELLRFLGTVNGSHLKSMIEPGAQGNVFLKE